MTLPGSSYSSAGRRDYRTEARTPGMRGLGIRNDESYALGDPRQQQYQKSKQRARHALTEMPCVGRIMLPQTCQNVDLSLCLRQEWLFALDNLYGDVD